MTSRWCPVMETEGYSGERKEEVNPSKQEEKTFGTILLHHDLMHALLTTSTICCGH